jgi:uncharacterized membrane protein YdfJ with MMPL/SSD domain
MNNSPHTNVAARMGRWSARHRKTAIFGWLGFVVAALVLGGMLGTKKLEPNASTVGESGRADQVLADRYEKPPTERVLVQHRRLTVEDPAFAAVVSDVVRRVSAYDTVRGVRSPLDERNRGAVSRDRRSALVEFQLRATDKATAEAEVEPILGTVAAVERSHPSFIVGQFGDASAGRQLQEAFARDLEKAGLLSLPITLAILVVAFGALVASGIPLLLAFSAVLATMGLLAVPSQLLPLDGNIDAIVLLIGLAVGVDYSMFYLKRAREERAAGRSEDPALEVAAATSGRAVLISGLTVSIAMAGMFVTGERTFAGFGIATILVVAIAVVGSLTVLPALLSWLGDRVEKLRVPVVHRRSRTHPDARLSGWIVDRMLRRPLVAAVAAAGVLVGLGVAALQMNPVVPGPDTYPKSVPVMATYAQMQKAFPGGAMPLQVVIEADDVRSPVMLAALADFKRRALATGKINDPITVNTSRDGTVAVISVPVEGAGTDATSEAALAALREEALPATVGRLEGANHAVTGVTAASHDFNDLMASSGPLVFAFVLVLAFVLLLVTFRSLVIALTAIVLNLLSVAAAYGVLVLVFQHGVGKDVLRFDYTGGIASFLPMFLFVILFGLSMDYHVFILSRIREAFDQGMRTDYAIAHGVRVTAGVVTSAAIVMVAVFSVFATLSMLFLKQFGVGLAAAVLIDATIVRTVLLPATMKLLGDWNWYLPRWLEWLPRARMEPATASAAARAPQPAAQ